LISKHVYLSIRSEELRLQVRDLLSRAGFACRPAGAETARVSAAGAACIHILDGMPQEPSPATGYCARILITSLSWDQAEAAAHRAGAITYISRSRLRSDLAPWLRFVHALLALSGPEECREPSADEALQPHTSAVSGGLAVVANPAYAAAVFTTTGDSQSGGQRWFMANCHGNPGFAAGSRRLLQTASACVSEPPDLTRLCNLLNRWFKRIDRHMAFIGGIMPAGSRDMYMISAGQFIAILLNRSHGHIKHLRRLKLNAELGHATELWRKPDVLPLTFPQDWLLFAANGKVVLTDQTRLQMFNIWRKRFAESTPPYALVDLPERMRRLLPVEYIGPVALFAMTRAAPNEAYLRIPADLQAVAGLVKAVGAVITELTGNSSLATSGEFLTAEWANNVILHGLPAKTPSAIICHIAAGGELALTYYDWAKEWQPPAAADTPAANDASLSGRGMAIIHSLTKSFSRRRIGPLNISRFVLKNQA